jgi:hypothetical protein
VAQYNRQHFSDVSHVVNDERTPPFALFTICFRVVWSEVRRVVRIAGHRLAEVINGRLKNRDLTR